MAEPHDSWIDRALIRAANLLGGGSLLLFGAFLLLGPFRLVDLARSDVEALAINTVLSVVFFVQHSGMIRRSFQHRVASIVPRYRQGAVYSVVSGLALIAVVLFWQPTGWVVAVIEPPVRLLFHGLFVSAALGFVWAIRALGSFDGFGVRPVKARLRGESPRDQPLTIRGPYRWVRHPLYTLILVMIWASPDLTGDRLVFNITWTLWIVIGAHLEERDLIDEFGRDYLVYRKGVPMLIPWCMPRD